MSGSEKTTLNFTADGSKRFVAAEIGRDIPVEISGTWGSGTMTATITGGTVPLQTPDTADVSFATPVMDVTYTLSGSTSPDLNVIIEAPGQEI